MPALRIVLATTKLRPGLRYLRGRLPGLQGVLNPGQRNDEKRGQKHAQQGVDPDQGDIERAHAESCDQGAERAAKAVFHGNPRKTVHHYLSGMSSSAEAARGGDLVIQAVERLPVARYLLAVSGGRDSMSLLDAFAACRRDAVAVANFDHGTGAAAKRAARLVEREAERRSLPFVGGSRRALKGDTEASWRAARWEFLRAWAGEFDATVVTAHTRDDQIETVVMRILRGAGPRGLAGILARSAICRPLLTEGRDTVAAYAESRGVRFVDDPSNLSRAHLRNRVRLDLLPALEAAQPGFGRSVLALSQRAAEWRAQSERLVDVIGPVASSGSVAVPSKVMRAMPSEGLGHLWVAIAGRAGVVLDRRGTERVAAFTIGGKPGGRIPLSGGAVVECTPTTFVLRASP